MAQECKDFVDTYSQQLVDMLIADLNAQEICVYLKLCTDKRPDNEPATTVLEIHYGGEIGEDHAHQSCSVV